ncbi:YchJ family protein [Citrobacter sp. JGM124]|uniref:YchJ family protein n=1 Tax=Citrobacter sp. JGM124 TaxID=2799789 RepID=UPI001BA78F71|nr:YchJ family protein [Citrobacter sp. JGM124]MBS0847189.1 YchJ family protein [Citrobacter sp. JGM124]
MQLCPCGSGLEYSSCCQSYLDARQYPEHAEQLMRSRYTAFVLARADYLVASWHPTRRYPELESEISASFGTPDWLGLTVFEKASGSDQNEAYVSFVARFKESGKEIAIIERSRFLKENDQWYYVDGVRPAFGRNDACPCGSGKKFKKCCG